MDRLSKPVDNEALIAKETIEDEMGETSKDLTYDEKFRDDEISDDLRKLGIKTDGTNWYVDGDTINSLSTKEFNRLVYNEPEKFGEVIGKISDDTIDSLKISDVRKERLKSQISMSRASKNLSDTSKVTGLTKRRDAEVEKLANLQDEYVTALSKGEREEELAKLSREINKEREVVKAMDDAVGLHTRLLDEELTISKVETKTPMVVDGQIVRRENKPSLAAKNAIDSLKSGDIQSAARHLMESTDYRATRLMTSKADMAKYENLTSARIRRMKQYGAPNELVERMVKERAEYALQELSKKGDDMKRIAYKISQGDELTAAERADLWKKERQLGKDAMETEDGNKLIKGLRDDAISAGGIKKENMRNEFKQELDDCIKRGDCSSASLACIS